MNNIKLWFEQAEPDYYMFFLKAWIPFNAWYIIEYPLLKKKDTDIIKELQDSPHSKPKKIIKNFFDSVDYEALKFQSYFAELHSELDKTHLSHNGSRLSFRSLSLTENPIKHMLDVDGDGNVYKTENTSSFFQAYIEAKGGKVLLDFKKPIFDLEELKKDTNYIRLHRKIQKKICNLFERINPKKTITVISDSSLKKDYITMKSKNTCKIIQDTETVSKACIKVLYALRCMLFHGEVEPTGTNKKVYENAFYILKLIINKLN